MTGQRRNAPLAREFAASGAFSQRVAGVGFEPTLSRRLYSPSLLPESHAADQPVRRSRRISGYRRPLCVRGRRISGTVGPRTSAEKATDGARGRGYNNRPARLLAPDLPLQDACSLSLLPSSLGSRSVSWVPRASVLRADGPRGDHAASGTTPASPVPW